MDSNQTEVDTTWHIYVGTIATIIPATIAISLRFAARYVSSAGFWWDDYTIALSLVSFRLPFQLGLKDGIVIVNMYSRSSTGLWQL
jgi:hypothetical protein